MFWYIYYIKRSYLGFAIRSQQSRFQGLVEKPSYNSKHGDISHVRKDRSITYLVSFLVL
jgi:hypothetical protein